MFSHDAGRTWTKTVQVEEAHAMPGFVLVSIGVLVCSYGERARRLVFSLVDMPSCGLRQGALNYTKIREITPDRLRYIYLPAADVMRVCRH
jgi:hypothetical protein